MALDLAHPQTTLDPYATDVVAEGHRIRQLGHLVPVEIDGVVKTWATADHATAEQIFTSPDFRKDPEHWTAFRNGEIPSGWPLLALITMRSMLNRDGADHTRLRSLLSRAFTPRRVELLRPRIEEMAGQLLDGLADAEGAVDVRKHYAFPLPMGVICELFGVDDPSDRRRLADNYGAIVSSRSSEDEVMKAQAGLGEVIGRLIESKRARPGDDLTSALIAAHDEDQDRLSGEELAQTLLLMLFAGHETSKNLITNAIRSLLSHPDQLALVHSGSADTGWSHVVEETLRWASPIRVVMFYYAAKDVEMGDVLIRAGEPVLIYVAATGRDHAHFGTDADEFDVSRSTAAQHLSFARGVHYCIGAPLGRMTATIAVEALFRRFDVACADLDALVSEWTYASNSVQELPVTLTALATV
ncbi:cytochrome P450 [Streptomyces sp. NPDC058272]|uniref:cytochrome P450 family protein n=1 Tax=Streptomyces sp. NPDC058272 TaxID=3346415 RepID=UPI0036E6BC53